MTKSNLVTSMIIILALISAIHCSRETELPSLREAFKERFMIGMAPNDGVVSGSDSRAADIVVKHCNTITAENAMKWVNIHPEPDRYDFEAADRFVDFGERHKMFMVGHTLVWHSQIPDWAFHDKDGKLLKRDAMLARMKEHIQTVVGRYKGRVHAWDVVNEALSDEGPMQKTKWLETIGEEYVEKAFAFAHEADPQAELYYNDYSLEKPAKRDAALRLVKGLLDKGIRVDGIGIQGHWGMDYPIPEDFDALVNGVASLGLKLMVTEFDLDILPPAFEYMGAEISRTAEFRKEFNPFPDGLPDSMQTIHTERYAELFKMMVKHAKNISRVTFWGVYDKTSWLNDWPIRGRTSYPLLFDRTYQLKPAFHAVVKIAQEGD